MASYVVMKMLALLEILSSVRELALCLRSVIRLLCDGEIQLPFVGKRKIFWTKIVINSKDPLHCKHVNLKYEYLDDMRRNLRYTKIRRFLSSL
jgi:hypothetical protein